MQGDPTFNRRVLSPAVIPGNSTVTLYFETGTATYVSGNYPMEILLEGTDNQVAYNEVIGIPDNLVIQQPANIVINSVASIASQISQGSDTLVTVSLTNTGEAAMSLDTLTLSADKILYDNSVMMDKMFKNFALLIDLSK